MRIPDLLYFTRPPATSESPLPAPLAEASDRGLAVVIRSLPTHLITVTWTTEEFSPRWVVLICADDSTQIIEIDATTLQFQGARAAENTLRVLGIPVAVGGVGIGERKLPGMPVDLEGVFPGDTEFEALLANRAFVQWLKTFGEYLG